MSLSRFFSVLLAGVICLSCTNDESTAQAANVQLVKEAYRLLNQHDWRRFSNLFSDSISLKEATEGNRIIRQSKHQYINRCRKMQHTFPNTLPNSTRPVLTM